MDLLAYEALTGFYPKDFRENWKALCPIHSERTPSFFIHKETYLCHCFGCGVAGYLDNILGQAYEIPSRVIREQLGIPTVSRMATRKPPEVQAFSKAWLAGYPRITQHPFLERRGFAVRTVANHDTRWDSQKNRLVFPMYNLGEGPVGAVARNLGDGPKWETLWNTKKGNFLYSINGHDRRACIVVEGIFDAMMLYQSGYMNAVALVTAHATREHIRLLKQFNEVTIMLDNDEAGHSATDYLAKALRSSIKVSCVSYPEDKNDPCELTPNEVHEAVNNRLTYVEYTNAR